MPHVIIYLCSFVILDTSMYVYAYPFVRQFFILQFIPENLYSSTKKLVSQASRFLFFVVILFVIVTIYEYEYEYGYGDHQITIISDVIMIMNLTAKPITTIRSMMIIIKQSDHFYYDNCDYNYSCSNIKNSSYSCHHY